MDQALLQAFLALPAYKEASCLATYLAFDFEYDTQLVIQAALSAGKEILVPKIFPQGKMMFVPYQPDQLQKNHFGIWEPLSSEGVAKNKIDLIHVPALAVNAAGYRIGFGGGYYDRYLADFEGRTVSTVYPCQQLNFQPEAHDIRVGEVLIL